MTMTPTRPRTSDDVVDAVRDVLANRLACRHMARFGPDASLGTDLALDSLMTMNLLLHLEKDHGLVAPEKAITTRAAETVGEFAALFLEEDEDEKAAPVTISALSAPHEADRREGVHGEDYYKVKVHCFISCIADAVMRAPGLDERPLFFGVWDAPFVTGDGSVIRYHEPGMEQDFFREWAERLYGLRIVSWYDAHRSIDDNLATMRDLIARRTEAEDVMVMLDMVRLPERENLLNKDPFPHFVLLERTDDPETLLMRDVDYRWEGPMARERVEDAIRQPSVEGGYIVDRSATRAPSPDDIAAYFEASFHPRSNPLFDALRTVVAAHVRPGGDLAALEDAVADFPLLLVRKYAYEHGFAFFWRALQRDTASFMAWCDEIEALVRGARSLNFELLKLSRSADPASVGAVNDAIERLDRQERAIKDGLAEAFAAWQRSVGPLGDGIR
ncbi:phosphopantetheine-binding protein [Acuticoccus sediminis]|uniref:Phosphopantetheine-binding protein n=1 Tax=Acuticoccus sediminis TaxID=2184697 RepID=A0A8B2P006_9HYPH|nr:DUF6005 family protein [Acuticoccus sediminis]RAI01597.1 phosphopantetheine-binding protein [Acuticoccus sediminis]